MSLIIAPTVLIRTRTTHTHAHVWHMPSFLAYGTLCCVLEIVCNFSVIFLVFRPDLPWLCHLFHACVCVCVCLRRVASKSHIRICNFNFHNKRVITLRHIDTDKLHYHLETSLANKCISRSAWKFFSLHLLGLSFFFCTSLSLRHSFAWSNAEPRTHLHNVFQAITQTIIFSLFQTPVCIRLEFTFPLLFPFVSGPFFFFFFFRCSCAFACIRL